MSLGEHIRLVRRARGISRKKLAEAIGMHLVNYGKIERGTKNVTYDTLLRIADGLGVDLTVKLVVRRKAGDAKVFDTVTALGRARSTPGA